MKFNHFYAHLRKEAFQTFTNISAPSKISFGNCLKVLWRKYVAQETTATAKHKWHKFTFIFTRFPRRWQRMRWKSIWWHCPSPDRRYPIRKIITSLTEINQFGLPRKLHLWQNSRTSRKRTKTQWVEKLRRSNLTFKDSSTSLWQFTENEHSKVLCPCSKKFTSLEIAGKKGKPKKW